MGRKCAAASPQDEGVKSLFSNIVFFSKLYSSLTSYIVKCWNRNLKNYTILEKEGLPYPLG